MPELPEVQTMVDDLRRKIIGRRIIKTWVGAAGLIKNLSASAFQQSVRGRKIRAIHRRGKNIIFYFDNDSAMLIHPKLTGHFLVGRKQDFTPRTGSPDQPYLFQKKTDHYIYLIFYLDKNLAFGLSDLRKFAKVVFYRRQEAVEKALYKELGPDALEVDFAEFSKRLRRYRGRVKSALMNQKIIAGIGNIYADEILYLSKIHPLAATDRLRESQLRTLYRSMRKILTKAVHSRGISVSDFSDTAGQAGLYGERRLVYDREGERCRCGRAFIRRIKIGGRSSYFCPVEQKLTSTRIPTQQ